MSRYAWTPNNISGIIVVCLPYASPQVQNTKHFSTGMRLPQDLHCPVECWGVPSATAALGCGFSPFWGDGDSSQLQRPVVLIEGEAGRHNARRKGALCLLCPKHHLPRACEAHHKRCKSQPSTHPFNPVKVQMSIRPGYWQNNKADLFNQGCTIAYHIDMSIKQHSLSSHQPLLIKIKCSLFIVELGLCRAKETLFILFSYSCLHWPGLKMFFFVLPERVDEIIYTHTHRWNDDKR